MTPAATIAVLNPMPCSDTVVRVAALPAAGWKVVGGDAVEMDGGVTANFAVAAARLGAAVHVFGWAGTDPASRAMTAAFRSARIDTTNVVVRRSAPVFRTIVLVDPRGERGVVLLPPAAAPAEPEPSWGRALAALRPSLCFVGPWTALAARVATLARDTGSLVAATLESDSDAGDAADLAPVDLLFMSAEVAQRQGWNRRHPARMPAGWSAGPEVLVVTQGRGGSRYWTRSDGVGWHAPAPVVRPVDTTGAGDAFAAAFAVLWLEGVRGRPLLGGANAAGAIATTAAGPRGALATRRDIEPAIRGESRT